MTSRSLRAVLGLTLVVAATAAAPAASEPGWHGPESSGRSGDRRGKPTTSLRLFRAWLAAFNSGDRTRYAKFLKRNWPTWVPLIDRDLGLREFTGGFDSRKAGRASATRVSGWLEERDSDQFVSFTMWVSQAKRPKILALDLVPIPRPAAFPIRRLTEVKRSPVSRRSCASRPLDRFSGAALVARDGELRFAGAYGQADRERGIPNTIETRFRIGSMNKMFTAVATLQLVEAGKLALDDTVGKHLRGYPNKDVATKVTVRHLLTHTGGTGDIFGPEYDRNRLQLREHADYVRLYGSRAPNFEPGSRFEYSNYGFVLLGAIIEAVSGQSYYDYVREHVFGPAGMTSTDSLPESEEVANRSIGYMRSGSAQSWQPNTDWLPWRGTAAGGGYSTVGDVARFADALTSHELLSAASTELLTTGKVALGPGVSYAFGFVDFRDKDGNGSVGTQRRRAWHERRPEDLPEVRYVVVVLANFDPPTAQRISDYLDPRLPQS